MADADTVVRVEEDPGAVAMTSVSRDARGCVISGAVRLAGQCAEVRGSRDQLVVASACNDAAAVEDDDFARVADELHVVCDKERRRASHQSLQRVDHALLTYRIETARR